MNGYAKLIKELNSYIEEIKKCCVVTLGVTEIRYNTAIR